MAKDDVSKALAAHVLDGRSPLYRWLERHHDEITAVFASQARPAWEALAATARDNKVLDANGHPPTRHAVRKAWKTLIADKKRVPSHRPPASLPVAAERQPAALPSIPPPRPAAQDMPDAPPRERKPLVLRTARPLGPDEQPDDDGSTLPKPFSRTKQ